MTSPCPGPRVFIVAATAEKEVRKSNPDSINKSITSKKTKT